MARGPQFTVSKTSNYGTSHPVVARLVVQTHELLQFADLSEVERDSVLALYDGLKRRLLKCHEALVRLINELNSTVEECGFKEDGSSKYEPHVIGLVGEVETILYEAKNYLRDLLGILKVYFDCECDEASYLYDPKGVGVSRLAKWASGQFGEDDPFTKMLITEHEWTEDVIRRRNAVEHPGGISGTLHIHNFTRSEDGRYVLPTWNRDDNEPKGLYPDLECILENLLTLAEDLLVSCNVHRTKYKIIQYVEIPEEDRNLECPVRVVAQLKKGSGPAMAE